MSGGTPARIRCLLAPAGTQSIHLHALDVTSGWQCVDIWVQQIFPSDASVINGPGRATRNVSADFAFACLLGVAPLASILYKSVVCM